MPFTPGLGSGETQRLRRHPLRSGRGSPSTNVAGGFSQRSRGSSLSAMSSVVSRGSTEGDFVVSDGLAASARRPDWRGGRSSSSAAASAAASPLVGVVPRDRGLYYRLEQVAAVVLAIAVVLYVLSRYLFIDIFFFITW